MPPKEVSETLAVAAETSPIAEILEYPRSYKLDALPLKTLDVGFCGTGVHVSGNAFGNILLINGTHGYHGAITATAFKPLNAESKLEDSDLIRKYRRTLLEPKLLKNASAGFGVMLPDLKPLGPITIEHVMEEGGHTGRQWSAARTVCPCEGDITVITTLAVTVDGEVRQTRHISTTATGQSKLKWRLGLDKEGENQCQISRASYGQLTEGGKIPIPKVGSKDGLQGHHSNFSITSTYQGKKDTTYNKDPETVFATLAGTLEMSPAQTGASKPVDMDAQEVGSMYMTDLTSTSPVTITARFQFKQGRKQTHVQKQLANFAEWEMLIKSQAPQATMSRKDYIVWRNVAYMLDNCCIDIKDIWEGKPLDSVCVITDHVALPLGWNRDNYWQLRPLMQLRGVNPNSTGVIPENWMQWYKIYESSIDHVLFGHLNWVFRQAKLHSNKKGETLETYEIIKPSKISTPTEPPKVAKKDRNGFWPRSFINNGKPKDSSGIFQLDQQCYPFLELCDFWKTYSGSEPSKVAEARALVQGILSEPRFTEVLQLLIGEMGSDLNLIHTDETPGDDHPKHGNLFSCNLLVWYTFKRLVGLINDPAFKHQATKLQELRLKLEETADVIHAAMMQHYVCKTSRGTHRRLFAYDCGYVKSGGKKVLDHDVRADGNDIPTLSTKVWGFVGDDKTVEETWQNTMDYAFDPMANKAFEKQPAGSRLTYWVGEGNQVSGLGSEHSPKPWPLGIYQEWRYFTMRGNTAKADDAWERIKAVQQWDGTFSETVDMTTAECESKAWFSWPGAMIAGAIIDDSLSEGPLSPKNIKVAAPTKAKEEGGESGKAHKTT